MTRWVVENWFNLLSAVGIIGGLLFTAFSLRSEAKTRRVANLLTITTNHREVWKEWLRDPHLARVLDTKADLAKHPVTREEELFVNLVILHLSSVYYALHDELMIKLEGLRPDVSEFLSLPIPSFVWAKTRQFQNDDFVAFVEVCINGE